MKYSLQIDKKFKALIESQFGDYLVAGLINGRGAFKIAQADMDIDTMVILDDSMLNDKELFKEKWAGFVLGYRDIHTLYGFKPDNAFPGDFVTVSQVYDAVNGRGFVNKDGQIYLQPMNSIQDESSENDYRLFRSMLIIGRYISGNESFLNDVKSLSTDCLIKYLFIKKPEMTVNDIITELLSGNEKELYGFDKRYEPHFSRYMLPLIRTTLSRLIKYGYINRVPGAKYKAQRDVYEWGKLVAKRDWTAEHLLTFGDSFFSSQCKKIFSGYNAGSHWDKLSHAKK
jgi:hypothetical protein